MIVIGIEGKAGSGKSTVAMDLSKKLQKCIHIEESDMLLKFVDVACFFKNMGKSNNEIASNINNIDVTYKIDNNKVEFILGHENFENKMTDLEKKLFVSKNIELKELVEKKIYQEFNRIIKNIKDDYNIIVSGHELEKACPIIDYLFCLNVNDDVRKERQIRRDGDKEKVKEREAQEEKIFSDSKKAIIIDSTNLSVDEVGKSIINYLSSSCSAKEIF